MSEANKEEVDKCKKIAMAAMSSGDTEKAVRFLEKAKRMSPGDGSIDGLIEQAKSGPPPGAAPSAPSPQNASSEGPRMRRAETAPSVSSSGNRVNKAGKEYTPEQMKMVQGILKEKDYYSIFNVDRNAREDEIKKAYKKLALKLHPDKCGAPGAEEAFKKVSKAFQCLTDSEKKRIYDQYGDEDRIPQHHRQNFHQGDFMTPEDLFAAFFGGGAFHQHHHHQQRHHHQQHDGDGPQRAQLFQMLPVILLVVLTLASNISGRDNSGRFSFQAQGQYQFERTTRTLGTVYFVTQDFEEHYQEGTKAMAEFERQVEIYYVRQKHSDCDYQEQVMYKKVMLAKRRGTEEDVREARNHPRPACKEMERIKRRHQNIYRQALYAAY